jgi:hypothetical protein
VGLAEAWRLEARVTLARGDASGAAAWLSRAVALYRRLGAAKAAEEIATLIA